MHVLGSDDAGGSRDRLDRGAREPLGARAVERPDDAPPEREAWDYEAFVRCYTEIARQHGGWDFDRLGPSPEELRGWYESTTLWDSICDFARTRFQLDQQI